MMPRSKVLQYLYKLVLAATTLLCGGVSVAETAQYMNIPNSIQTRNVPAVPATLGERLGRYTNTRSAGLYGWQGSSLLIATRFGNTNQLHRVAQPLGYRQQLTFLPEPLAGVAIPADGAGEEVVISWDVGGSEFDQLFLFNLRTGTSRMVSDGKSLYGHVHWGPDRQSFAYVTTQRNGRNWDTHIQDVAGRSRAVFESEQGYWYPLGWSPDGTRLLMKHRVSINVSSIHELELASGRLTPLVGSNVDGSPEQVSIPLAAYDGNGGIYFTSDANSEYVRLQHMTLADRKVRVVSADHTWDVSSFAIAPSQDKLVYALNENGSNTLHGLSLPRERKLRLPQIPMGRLYNMEFSPDGAALAFSMATSTSPADVFVADLKTRKLTRWTESEVGGLDKQEFVEPQSIEYLSFDGRKIPAFVYKPDTPGPHPVVVLIHGGPESQYRPGFSATVQSYVAEMNVAVIAPNVRGSAGYGKSYLKLDNGYKREDSVKDIGALLDWIDGRTEFRSDRVAVLGGSYGGYMVLASMVHYGSRLAAAVESVGISNFVTFLENTQPYRQDMRRVEYGDERDPDMRAHLESISPLNHVDKMQTPLLISQGANDPRVPASESNQIWQALAERDVPAWYVLAMDEGHGMRKKVNREYDRAVRFAFLNQHLNRE
ncbi:MAG: alpha/beta fold hydrolase [Pseudomonadota bacterium]